MIQGLAIHCHHNILVEYCYDYEERVNAIKRTKPLNEREIRLRLFKILPDEALKDIPEEWRKADAEWRKANAELQKTNVKWRKAYTELRKADAELQKTYAEWGETDKDTFHKKWCGCDLWVDGEIIFNKE